jgi:hypothetical protein
MAVIKKLCCLKTQSLDVREIYGYSYLAIKIYKRKAFCLEIIKE